MASLEDQIREQAAKLGFALTGFADPRAADPAAGEALRAWLAAGCHGSMSWMEERADQRASATALWPQARSLIALAMSYAPATDPRALADARAHGRISVYARGRDYHAVVKKGLKALARWLTDTTGCQLKLFVDTAPVMEKPIAAAAGLGWQGKHSNLLSRDHGNWLFLGVIMTDLDLRPDAPASAHCGSCAACITACPTGAIVRPGVVDARACISYLTIEHSGPIPTAYRRAIGNRIYGCDDCLAACPWNRFATPAQAHPDFASRDDLDAPPLAALLMLDDAQFRARFSKNPIKRIGLARWQRNCLIAAGNSGDQRLRPLIESHRRSADPVVAEAADWAAAALNG